MSDEITQILAMLRVDGHRDAITLIEQLQAEVRGRDSLITELQMQLAGMHYERAQASRNSFDASDQVIR